MLEQLDYLIRTLTYRRSSLELMLANVMSDDATAFTEGQVAGLSIALGEVYRMVIEISKEEN